MKKQRNNSKLTDFEATKELVLANFVKETSSKLKSKESFENSRLEYFF